MVAAADEGLIASHYQPDPGRQAPLLGGLRSVPMRDRRDPSTPLVAIESPPGLPARPHMLLGRAAPIPELMLPIDQGPGPREAGRSCWFGICPPPPGPSLAEAPGAWRDADLIGKCLLPAAAALDALQARGLTHRAIRLDNMFRAGPADRVTLGPCFATPPAYGQDAASEPVYVAVCGPAARGDGCTADDVYALGVLLLTLATGRRPLEGLSATDIIQRKLQLGSYAALVGDASLPPAIADLLRGMLAEDPEHRPSPALLLNAEAARARRVAARPPRRAQRALAIAGATAWTARELAHALGTNWEAGAKLLRDGSIDAWLRRGLGDAALAGRLQEALARRAGDTGGELPSHQPAQVMRAVAVLDPLAPLFWRGEAFWPDGLGPALATAEPAPAAALEEAVAVEAVAHWAACRPERCDVMRLRQDARAWQAMAAARFPIGGRRRLMHGLNPLLPCASPLLAGIVVARLADLLPALEAVAPSADRARLPIDGPIAAFVAAHGERGLESDLVQLGAMTSPGERAAALRLFARLQLRLQSGPLPGLATWLVACGAVGLESWRGLARREGLRERFAELARAGMLPPILLLAQDEAARDEDHEGAERAMARVREIEAALDRSRQGADFRAAKARHVAREIAAGAGVAATLAAVFALALS